LLGSSAFASLLALYTPLCGVLYVALAYAAGGVTGDGGWAAQSAVGFSGVLFALAVDESALTPAPTRSVFGLLSVPTRLYPWVLMLVLQLLLPNISFLGHLAGILAGSLHAAGGLAWALPSLPAGFGASRPVAIVTGANTGVGLEASRGLLARGFDVVVAARSEARGRAAAAALNALNAISLNERGCPSNRRAKLRFNIYKTVE
jgi:hypothetical protein